MPDCSKELLIVGVQALPSELALAVSRAGAYLELIKQSVYVFCLTETESEVSALYHTDS